MAKTGQATTSRTGLRRDRILAAALEIVDRDGLEALTMRALAESLGVSPMATYRHFAHKGALLDALLDDFVGELPVPPANDDWRSIALTIARDLRKSFLQHRGLAAAAVDRPTLGRSGVRLSEAVYGPLRGAGFDDRTTERAANLVFGYALGFVGLEVPRLAAAAARDPETHVTQDDLAGAYRAVDPALIPHTLAIAPTPGEFISDAQFEWGLAVILDGIAGQAAIARPRL